MTENVPETIRSYKKGTVVVVLFFIPLLSRIRDEICSDPG
jgi:hypothetical protein